MAVSGAAPPVPPPWARLSAKRAAVAIDARIADLRRPSSPRAACSGLRRRAASTASSSASAEACRRAGARRLGRRARSSAAAREVRLRRRRRAAARRLGDSGSRLLRGAALPAPAATSLARHLRLLADEASGANCLRRSAAAAVRRRRRRATPPRGLRALVARVQPAALASSSASLAPRSPRRAPPPTAPTPATTSRREVEQPPRASAAEAELRMAVDAADEGHAAAGERRTHRAVEARRWNPRSRASRPRCGRALRRRPPRKPQKSATRDSTRRSPPRRAGAGGRRCSRASSVVAERAERLRRPGSAQNEQSALTEASAPCRASRRRSVPGERRARAAPPGPRSPRRGAPRSSEAARRRGCGRRRSRRRRTGARKLRRAESALQRDAPEAHQDESPSVRPLATAAAGAQKLASLESALTGLRPRPPATAGRGGPRLRHE